MRTVIYVECRKQAHYAECHYAVSRGAIGILGLSSLVKDITCAVLRLIQASDFRPGGCVLYKQKNYYILTYAPA